jgi:tetratricopeptide (TPR) repeat protein
MWVLRQSFAVGALLLFLAGCATPQADSLLADAGALPVRAEVAKVPFYPQEKFYCGPAAMAMALTWSGLPVTQDDMASEVYTPGREGSLRTDMLSGARRNGRLAVRVRSLRAMLQEIAAGNPVLVFQNLGLSWYTQWHYAVAFGYDLGKNELLLRSGVTARRTTGLELFERTWARGDYWAITVLPPGRLPVTATEQDVLPAAIGLERAGRHVAAAEAYAAMTARWPASLGAQMGLGNMRFAAKDLAGAETAFRAALKHHPKAADAWNNLAYALARQGRREAALSAARKAVAIGGPRVEAYRDTLRELSGKSA